jgi:hypothetical protein
MKSAIRSMYAQAAYLLGTGLGLLLAPNFLLGLFGLPPAEEVWIRVLGALALTLLLYYFQMIRQAHRPFFEASVWGRYFFCACLIVLALTGMGPQVLWLLPPPRAAWPFGRS